MDTVTSIGLAAMKARDTAEMLLAALKLAWEHGDMPVHIRSQIADAIAKAEAEAGK